MALDFNVSWIHGAADCSTTTDPPIQVHAIDADTMILRQSKCSEPLGSSFEAPFMYLLFGNSLALLLDSGASRAAARFPIAATVDSLLAARAQARGQPRLKLVVAHSHSHGDHFAGDEQLRGLPQTTVVGLGVAAVKTFFGIQQWPTDLATLDLGGRVLDVLPIPGHEDSHIALYDRATGILLTGDTFYPGLLVVNDWRAYRDSAARLKTFASHHPITFVLGAHIEMTSTPRRWFGLGKLFQPGEHALELKAAQLNEWAGAVESIGSPPRTDRHDEFIIYPSTDPLPSLEP